MKNLVRFTDARAGYISISGGKNKYFKTKDSTSPSGHSLVAQIEMTHSGIVTRNYGFYLPSKMRDGAASFTTDYNKPVLIGHDDGLFDGDSDPIGRVIQADYVDTSSAHITNDKYLSNIATFKDADKNKSMSYVQYVIANYDGQEDYRGMGHILGTLSITDDKAIQKILDGRYLTVSTSMVSDVAICSICGKDWVAEGMCDHQRGTEYDEGICVLIPGTMGYEHLGIVNSPADKNAHGFAIISANSSNNGGLSSGGLGGLGGPTPVRVVNNAEDELYKCNDGFEVAAKLFAYKDNSLVSLSSEEDINLIEVKDNIQKMENKMKLDKKQQEALQKRIQDAIATCEKAKEFNDEDKKTLCERIFNSFKDSKEISDELIQEKLKVDFEDAAQKEKEEKLVKLQTYWTKVRNDRAKARNRVTVSDEEKPSFKLQDGDELTEEKINSTIEAIKVVKDHALNEDEVNDLARVIVLNESKDALTQIAFNLKDKELSDTIKDYKDAKEGLIDFKTVTAEEIYGEMKKNMEESDALSDEELKKLKASDFCGKKDYFPIIDKAHAEAALKVLGKCVGADSVIEKILVAMNRKMDKLDLNFDSNDNSCNNNNVAPEILLDKYNDAVAKLKEAKIEIPEFKIDDSEKDQEIEILESQLEAANEELDLVSVELDKAKKDVTQELATRIVDMKISSGNYEIKDRTEEIKEHTNRKLDSLRDTLKDLEEQAKAVVNDGTESVPTEGVEDPTLSKSGDESAGGKATDSKEKEKYHIYDKYRQRVTAYGKKEADRWLRKTMAKNGSIVTLD